MERCRGNLQPLSKWILKKFCNQSPDVTEILYNHSVTRCHRNSVTTQSLDVTEILQSLSTMLLQKFYNHSTTGCHRNSAITQSQAVAEILRPLKHWMLQKFCDHSVTSCRRNSGTTQPLDVAKILRSLSHKLSQKFCNPSVTSCRRNSVATQPLNVAEILRSLSHKLNSATTQHISHYAAIPVHACSKTTLLRMCHDTLCNFTQRAKRNFRKEWSQGKNSRLICPQSSISFLEKFSC